MNITEAIDFVRTHHLTNLKHSTCTGYGLFFVRLQAHFVGRSVDSITSEEISQFLDPFTLCVAKVTRHLRYAQTKAWR